MRPGATKRITLSGTIFALLLVGGLGNQWVFKESVTQTGDQWYRVLLSIADETLWIVDKSGLGDDLSMHIPTKFVVAGYVGILALLVVVALVLGLGARGLGTRAGGFAAFLLGWFSLVLGGSVYGLMIYAIGGDDIAGRAEGYGEFHHAMLETQAGAYFGVVCGWVLGLVTVVAYASAGSHAHPPGVPGPGQPVYAEGPGGQGYFAHSRPTAHFPAQYPPQYPAHGAPPPAQGPPSAYAGPPRRPQQPPRVAPTGQDTHDAPTTIRPAGPPPSSPPRRPGSTDTPPGGFRP